MRKIAPLTFHFTYIQSPMGEAGVKNAYRRIYEMAKRNILMRKEMENRDKNIVDSDSTKVQTADNEPGRIINDSGISSKTETFQRNDLPDDKTEINSGGESGNEMADKQPIFDQFTGASK